MEQSDNPARREDEAIASTRYPTSARLVAAIHCGDEAAIREFFLFYAPLMRDQARRMSIAPDERSEFITTTLDDVVLHLMEHHIVPRHLTRYVVASLRNRARNWHRDSGRRLAARERAYSQPSVSGERIVAECHSEYSLRASSRFVGDISPLPGSIARLAARLARELTRDELVMLICVERHLPLREIAEQLGITYAAIRVRLHRLRERFRKLAIEHVHALKPDERHELEQFFRRAEVSLNRPDVVKREEKVNGKA